MLTLDEFLPHDKDYYVGLNFFRGNKNNYKGHKMKQSASDILIGFSIIFISILTFTLVGIFTAPGLGM